MDPTRTNLCFYILLPIVPAFLLFLSLPKVKSSTGGVEGTFHGMQIKLGGSFAGYFAILLLMFVYFPVKAPTPFREFIVYGRLLNTDGTPDKNFNPSEISVEPPQLTFTPDGTFSMHVIVPYGVDPPILSFSRSGTALQKNISLAQFAQSSSALGTQSIALGDIQLQDAPTSTSPSLPAYAASGSKIITSLTPVIH